MEITLVEEINQENSDYLFHWKDRVFPVEGKSIEWAKSDWHLLAFNDDRKPSAHLGYGIFEVEIDEKTVINVVGVGGVVVRPECQGKGIPAKIFDFLHHSNHANSLADTFTLFCPKRLESYYKKHGYTKFKGTYTFTQNGNVSSSDDFIFMYHGRSINSDNIHINNEPW